MVLLNAAAVLVAAGLAGDLKQGVAMGAEAIDSGQAAVTLEKLRQFGAKASFKAQLSGPHRANADVVRNFRASSPLLSRSRDEETTPCS